HGVRHGARLALARSPRRHLALRDDRGWLAGNALAHHVAAQGANVPAELLQPHLHPAELVGEVRARTSLLRERLEPDADLVDRVLYLFEALGDGPEAATELLQLGRSRQVERVHRRLLRLRDLLAGGEGS